ncbi:MULTISPECIES: M14 family metallopeptidase [Streptomyces]|uniref:Murein tripeptide amidase MpaA n=1 Tax=Streptomyces nymphaeiformis TaxID=2663842 RepID=A0A7W7TZT7_9ACTN|nr:M14 family metallopeptidase [Streptomyces nymphaeiformis]MBB4981000.1 murein tripeptide amidase MpaA [Streptomyces nymphaeiformis]
MSYLNIVEVESAVASLATAFPHTCELIDLPERSFEGRAAHALRIGTAEPGVNDAVVLIGGAHAREWGSCEILVNLAADLLHAHSGGTGLTYGGTSFTSAQVHGILDGLDVVVFPLVNPDGRHYSQTVDPMWRRNRNPAQSGGHPEAVGVDINRNYDHLFDFETAFHPNAPVRVSADPADPDQVYQGPSAFSEPETRNVRWLLDEFPRTRWFVDVHSYTQDMLYVWGDDNNQSVDPTRNFRNPAFDGKRGLKQDLLYAEFVPKTDTDDSAVLAEQFCKALRGVRGKNYTPQPAFDLYPTCGTSDDYAYARHIVDPQKGKILAFTVEWGKSFHPPWAEMEKIVLDVDAGLVQFCLTAGT